MRLLAATGWVLFAGELLFVALLFITGDMGDDAAGRGMARGFAILLGPIVLLAGALLWWGGRRPRGGGARAAFWIGLGIVSTPVVFGAASCVTDTLRSIEHARGRAEYGRFDAPALTTIARAIDRDDIDKVRRLLGDATGKIDFAARDRRGRTILGHAIERVLSYDATERSIESVRLLLAAGARPVQNAIAPERTSAEPDGHLLLVRVVGGNSPHALALLELLLTSGLSANGVDMDDRPILFSSYLNPPELEVLMKHGVDLQARDVRTDMPGWSVLMHAASMSDWTLARFYLEHGVPADYKAADGQSVLTILEEERAERERSGSAPDEQFDALLAAIRARSGTVIGGDAKTSAASSADSPTDTRASAASVPAPVAATPAAVAPAVATPGVTPPR